MNCTQLPFKLNFFAKFFAPGLVLLLVPIQARAAVDVPNTLLPDSGQLAQIAPPNGNLTDLEQQAIAEMNRARTNPTAYADWLESLKPYYRGNVLQLPNQPPIRTQEGVKAVNEAIALLRSLRPLTPLQLSVGMSMAARDHANDIGSKGIVGHYGSDGSQFLDRLNRYGSSEGAVGENISYGVTTAQAVVMQMIVDDGVAGRFHRDNILYDQFNVAGIACGAHQRYQQICTVVYSNEYRDRVALNSPLPNSTNPTRIGSSPASSPFPDAVSRARVLPTEAIPLEEPVNALEVNPAENRLENPVDPPSVPSDRLLRSLGSPGTSDSESPQGATLQPPTPLAQSEENPEETSPPAPDVETVPAPPPLPVDLLPRATEQVILQEEGTLADGDSVYERDGSLYDVYTFEGRSGQKIIITVESQDFDTFLAVFDDQDQIIGQNDDLNAEDTNSFLEITLPRDGMYRIFINGYDARDRGSYTVRVVE
jgi:uncharacterized protein YkwD